MDCAGDGTLSAHQLPMNFSESSTTALLHAVRNPSWQPVFVAITHTSCRRFSCVASLQVLQRLTIRALVSACMVKHSQPVH